MTLQEAIIQLKLLGKDIEQNQAPQNVLDSLDLAIIILEALEDKFGF